MASSSTHGTSQETELHACWRVVHIRLRSISANHQAAYVTEKLAEVLDVSYHDLARGFWPPGPEGKGGEVVKTERDICEAVRLQGAKMGDADRINSAANAAMEASEHLKHYGRESEGDRMEELGQELYELAVDVAERERCMYGRGRDGEGDGGSDAEMTDR